MTGSNAIGIAGLDYAKKVQVLIKLITELRALGAQVDIDLPRIAVIGNQSAGKSSLVEAISGISVPRAAGTCTRCPMECRLTYSTAPFKCQVLLRIEHDENGNRLPEVKEEKFGPVLHDKSELEDMLRRAQLAILNPSLLAESFVNIDLSRLTHGQKPAGSTRQLQFSSNVVCLDLSSPEVTDLSFIDLPGIISNVSEGEDPKNIELVKSLVKEHISGNALILLTITMRDDIQNQSAALLAKEADPYGLRTIGVLTKPDTLQEGEHQPWLDVIAGRNHALHHGYYVTKQPTVAELTEKLHHSTARERENSYFSSEAPWSTAVPHIKSRMGVPNLTRELSRLLSQLIEATLPKLRADSKRNLERCRRELESLPPPPPENAITELLNLVTSFTADLSSYVWGSPTYESLIQRCRPAYANFMKDILKTGPNFVAEVKNANLSSKNSLSGDSPSGRAVASMKSASVSPVTVQETAVLNPPTLSFAFPTLNNSSAFSAFGSTNTASTTNAKASSFSPFGDAGNSNSTSMIQKTVNSIITKKEGLARDSAFGANVPLFGSPAQPKAKKTATAVFMPTPPVSSDVSNSKDTKTSFDGVFRSAEVKQDDLVDGDFAYVIPERAPMYLNDVHDFIESSLTRQLPLTVPQEAKAKLIEHCFEDWPVLSEKCFDVVFYAFKECLDKLVTKKFSGYTNGGLCEHVRNIVDKELEKTKKTTLDRLLWIVELEYPPYTQNEHYFVDYKDKYLAQYRKQYKKNSGGVGDVAQNVLHEALAKLAEIGYTGITQLDLEKLNGPDVYEQELVLMAEVHAYFRVAYKRIIDTVPRVIDHEFLHKTRKGMQTALIKELGMGEHAASARAAAYLSEEPRFMVRREELRQTQERLTGVLERLYMFPI